MGHFAFEIDERALSPQISIAVRSEELKILRRWRRGTSIAWRASKENNMLTKFHSFAVSAVVMGLLAMACDKPGEDAQKKRDQAQQELTQAQIEANRKVDQATTEANRKVDQATAEANQKVDQAEAKADLKLTKADADFTKSLVDYRASKQKDLADFDKSIADLTLKDQNATGKAKADLDAQLPNIRAMRDNAARSLRAIDNATPMTFDSTKVNVDKSFDDLKAAIKKAS